MITYKIILPVTHDDLYDGVVKSIDEDITESIIVQDNRHNNIGVSRAWNKGVRDVLKNKIDYLIILSQSMRFNDGMRDFIAKLNNDGKIVQSTFGWHLIAIPYKMLKQVGEFDENFFAYYEDSDYIRRMYLMGLYNPFGTSNEYNKVDARLLGEGIALKRGVVYGYNNSYLYFLRKWGNTPNYSNEKIYNTLYKTPFNNPINHINKIEVGHV